MRPYYAVATHCGFEVDSQKDLQAIKSTDENKGLQQINSVAFDLKKQSVYAFDPVMKRTKHVVLLLRL